MEAAVAIAGSIAGALVWLGCQEGCELVLHRSVQDLAHGASEFGA